MDDFDVKNHDQEIDDLLSEVKGLLGEEPEQPEEDSRDTLDAPQKAEEPGAPMTADDVNIDFEKFYDDAVGFPDEGIYTPPTAYEQSKSAYQVARRAEYDRVREAEREARDRQRIARDREEERVMRRLESRGRKTAEKVKNPPKSDEEYAKWLYEQGVEPETEEHREYLRQREQQTEAKPPKKRRGHGFLKVVLALVLVLAIALGSVHFFVAKQPEAETGLGERKAGCATILIAGTDEGGYRTDTMMLFSVNRATGKMSLVSIPRDTLIYCEYSVPKINSAYGWAGGGEAGMENLMNENYEDGTYTYEDMTQDGSVLVVDMAFQSLRTNETAEEYAEYAARFAALDTGEGEPRDVTCFQDEDYTQNLSYPVYIVWYTTGSGEDQREWMVYTVDTDDYTYLYAFGTIADEADDMQDVFYNICDHLELVD